MLKYIAAEFHWSILQFQRYCISVHRKNKSSLLHEDGHIRQAYVTLFFFFSASFTHFLYLKEICLHRWGKKLHWQKSCLSNLGVASVDSVKKLPSDSKRSNSCNFSSASSHSMERHQYLQRGISLLKTSVTAITTYYYNTLALDVPSNLFYFRGFC